MNTPAGSLNKNLVFHHLGLAVKRPDESRSFLSCMGYEIGEPVFDPGQNVHLAMCTHATEPPVEIIWPGETKGPVMNMTHKHPAGIIYHVCYTTINLAAAIAELEKAGLYPVCVSPPKPAPLFGGRRVSFYNLIGIGLVEILE